MTSDSFNEKTKALRATIAWMDLVMANVNESIVVLDNNWRIIFANAYLADILGADRVLLLGKVFWDIVPMLTDGNKKAAKLPLKSIAELNNVYELKYKNITLKLLLNAKYVPALDQAVCIMSDVSIELQAENALMKMQKEIDKLQAENRDLKKVQHA